MTLTFLAQLGQALANLETHLRSFSIGVTSVDSHLSTYQDDLSRLAEKARQGDLDQSEFEQQAEALAVAALLALFNLGRQSDELDYEAMAAYEQEKINAMLAIRNLSRDIFAGKYAEQKDEADNVVKSDADGRLALSSRIVLWAATAAGVYALGQLYRGATVKYTWRRGGTLHSCGDCIRLDGQTHTALEWRLSGFRPQSGALSCGGWRCLCFLVETDDKVTGDF